MTREVEFGLEVLVYTAFCASGDYEVMKGSWISVYLFFTDRMDTPRECSIACNSWSNSENG